MSLTRPTATDSANSNTTKLMRTNSGNASSSQNTTAQSPIDWANFMNFQTPPVVSNGAQGGTGVAAGGPAGNYRSYEQQQQQQQQQQQSHRPDDQYQNFAHGIAISRPSPSNTVFQQPLPRNSTSSSSSRRQFSQSSTSSLPQYHVPSQTSPQARSPEMIGKGKSPASSSAATQQPRSGNTDNSSNNGLSLDPSAFSRDIRFQVPSFLTNQVGGAPTFPPGGEAWSGFSGANLFGQDAVGQLTPGTIFSNAFGLNASDQYCELGRDNTGGNIDMSGFNGNSSSTAAWEITEQSKNPEQQQQQQQQLHHNSHKNMGMFYVNPNPSPSTLAPRNPPHHQQHHQPQQLQQQQHSYQQQHQQQQPQHSMASPRKNQPPTPIQTNQYAPSSSSDSMPTSAILPQPPAFPNYNQPNTYDNVPSMSAPTSTAANTINFASSSSAPYAPPSNTQSLLAGPMPPSLADGPGLYSTTGFDMVGVLARVAARRDPSTVLGPVDLSCSFLVVDIRRYDSPIVYASPSFSTLTGYDLPQILGRNCRFLQGPDGEVVKGSKRKYTDNTAVAHLKRMLNAGKECQASLINYRRGGVPFINLVTVVPIPWDGTDIVYHVGFQVDLVEQPNAILRNMRDGSYQVNYTVSNPPEKPLRPPPREIGITGLSGEVMEIMGTRVNTLGASGEEAGRMEWLKMVLDNTDDFVHALSLKGFFQYVSPSVRRVLEYEPEELLNKNISEFAHPSDIVPLMRELKDSTHAPTDGSSARHVNLVFRIRRKNSGYIWIESVGRLVVEAGKGRKAVILSGRARSVPTLPWDSVSQYGGLAETEFWGKISFQGLLIHATAGVQGVLGQPADDIIGQSFFSLLPGGDNGPPSTSLLQADPSAPVATVSHAIRRVLNGETHEGAVSVNHKLVHKSGQQVDVVTVIYAPRRSTSEIDVRATSEDSNLDSDSSSRRLSTDGGSANSSGAFMGTPPINLVIQVKLVASPGSSIAEMTLARPVVHPPLANVFEELETTRGTSWQYELHQLRMLNRRLKEDIAAAKARGAGKGKGKKRKLDQDGSSSNHTTNNSNNATVLPDQFKAAPRHQLAPGFGLVTPGLNTPYF
ncbi:hypothetical protein I317_04300 [Kwoniella heveanensis CBS 569]|nr:hypothetical protein I317_04300 [Kwoniella heveanensis CBS 569]